MSALIARLDSTVLFLPVCLLQDRVLVATSVSKALMCLILCTHSLMVEHCVPLGTTVLKAVWLLCLARPALLVTPQDNLMWCLRASRVRQSCTVPQQLSSLRLFCVPPDTTVRWAHLYLRWYVHLGRIVRRGLDLLYHAHQDDIQVPTARLHVIHVLQHTCVMVERLPHGIVAQGTIALRTALPSLQCRVLWVDSAVYCDCHLRLNAHRAHQGVCVIEWG